jgi:hypothetical protein
METTAYALINGLTTNGTALIVSGQWGTLNSDGSENGGENFGIEVSTYGASNEIIRQAVKDAVTASVEQTLHVTPARVVIVAGA